MGYRFSWQGFFAPFSSYDILLTIWPWAWATNFNSTRCDVGNHLGQSLCVNWVCEQWATLFWCVMLMVMMENLAITQHYNMLCYAIICGVDYQPHINSFKLGDCILVANNRSITLDVIIGHVNKCVQKVLSSKMLLLKG